MAETKLAMSLDALIAQATTKKPREKKEKKPQAPTGQAPQSGPRKGLNKNKQKNANANGAAQPQQQQQQRPKQQQPQQVQQQQGQRQSGQRNRNSGAANLGVRGGQVQKRNVIEVPARVLRQQPQQQVPVVQRKPQFQQRQPAPEGGKWQHDMYVDEYAPPKRAPLTQVAVASTSSKLIIKNLHHQVSSDDLLELFSTCGTVKGHGVNYDTSGRSVGTGWVVFDTRAEAVNAKKEYNGVKLDGQAMEIFSSDEAGGSAVRKLSSGISVQKPGSAAPAGNNRVGGPSGGSGGQRLAAAAIRETAAASRGGRGGARGGRLRSAVVGRDKLDADLADYMQD